MENLEENKIEDVRRFCGSILYEEIKPNLIYTDFSVKQSSKVQMCKWSGNTKVSILWAYNLKKKHTCECSLLLSSQQVKEVFKLVEH